MRVTQHSSRTRSNGTTLGTRHNDRQYDTSKADNINQDPEHENIYYVWSEHGWIKDGSITFDQAEHNYYKKVFQKDLDAQNERAIKARHRERIQDIDQYRQSRKHCPEELILQIGSVKDGTVSKDVFTECVIEYINRMIKESDKHAVVLNVAFHFDEAVPHAHIRRAWWYEDKDKHILRPGQEKGLEQAGYLPYSLREGQEDNPKYCNRKIAFDSYMRDIWLDICEEHGLEVERDPVPDGHHNRSKEDMIRDQYADALDLIAKADRLREVMEKDVYSDIFQLYDKQTRQELRDALHDLAAELDDWER